MFPLFLGAWVDVLKALPLATTEVFAAIECCHHLLKLRLLNEKDSNIYQRADWLVDKLGIKVHSYYWLDEFTGRENFARYWKDEWKSGLTSWRRALQIPDSDVIVDGKYAKVISRKREGKVHTILNPGCEFAICDCQWSRMGNLCKHVIKSTKVFRDKGLAAPSTSLFEFNQALTSILRHPPHDSLSRDHAIALVVCIQSQLNGLFDLEKGRTTSSTSVQAAANSELSSSDEPIDADTNLIHENHSVSENVCGMGEVG